MTLRIQCWTLINTPTPIKLTVTDCRMPINSDFWPWLWLEPMPFAYAVERTLGQFVNNILIWVGQIKWRVMRSSEGPKQYTIKALRHYKGCKCYTTITRGIFKWYLCEFSEQLASDGEKQGKLRVFRVFSVKSRQWRNVWMKIHPRIADEFRHCTLSVRQTLNWLRLSLVIDNI